jgi:hypothetical protein
MNHTQYTVSDYVTGYNTSNYPQNWILDTVLHLQLPLEEENPFSDPPVGPLQLGRKAKQVVLNQYVLMQVTLVLKH